MDGGWVISEQARRCEAERVERRAVRGGRGAAFTGRLGGATWWGGGGPKNKKMRTCLKENGVSGVAFRVYGLAHAMIDGLVDGMVYDMVRGRVFLFGICYGLWFMVWPVVWYIVW